MKKYPLLYLALTMASLSVYASDMEDGEAEYQLIPQDLSGNAVQYLDPETEEAFVSLNLEESAHPTQKGRIQVNESMKVIGKGIAPKKGASNQRIQIACVGDRISSSMERSCSVLQFLLSEGDGRQFLLGPRITPKSGKHFTSSLREQIAEMKLAKYFSPHPGLISKSLLFGRGPGKWIYLGGGILIAGLMATQYPVIVPLRFAMLWVGFPIGVDILKLGTDRMNPETTTDDEDRLGFSKMAKGLQKRSRGPWQFKPRRIHADQFKSVLDQLEAMETTPLPAQ